MRTWSARSLSWKGAEVETRSEKDAKTLLIVRALLLFVVVLTVAYLGGWLLSRVGLDVPGEWIVPFVAAAALAATVFLRRHDDRRRR